MAQVRTDQARKVLLSPFPRTRKAGLVLSENARMIDNRGGLYTDSNNDNDNGNADNDDGYDDGDDDGDDDDEYDDDDDDDDYDY
eukprot:6570303-Heterocapsa_arctica.AAC.1